MNYFPVLLDIRQRNCLVVGGGRVGTRKAKALLNCGALVTVVSPEISAALQALADNSSLVFKRRGFRPSDLDRVFLVIGATGDEDLNRQIYTQAQARNLLCNIADRPQACNFILPATVDRGDLKISISTGGKSPALAKKLRRELEHAFGPEYAFFLHIMGAAREKLLRREHAPDAHKALFERLVDSELLQHVKTGDRDKIDALLTAVLGTGFRLVDLRL